MTKLTAPFYAQPCAGFRSQKAAQICAFFAIESGGCIEKLKLIKLVYLAERQFLSAYHHPMLFDEFYSLPHGPICSSTLNGIDGVIHRELWDRYIMRHGKDLIYATKAVGRDDLNHISDAELEVLIGIWSKYSDWTSSQIRNYTHQYCAEYTETASSRIPITYRQVLSALGEEDAVAISEEISEIVKLEGILEGNE